MIRYDQQETTPTSTEEEVVEQREVIQIDEKHQSIITKLFLDELKAVTINEVPLVNSITAKQIVLNPQITLEMLTKQLGKSLDSKEEFIKEYYMYRLDKFTDEAYGKAVTAIQEFPYSFQAGTNENLINYTFIA